MAGDRARDRRAHGETGDLQTGAGGEDLAAQPVRGLGERESLDLTGDDIADPRTAAALLREVFLADDVDTAAATLNRLLRENTGPLRLTSHDGGTPWHPHLDRAGDGTWGAWLLASSCLALKVLVWDHQRPPGRLCASSDCRQVFVTQGNGPERRYCSRRCATRERVAAHRRAKSGQGPS